jgi:hypothetical protein
VAGLTAFSTLWIEASRALAALIPGAAATDGRLATGEPTTLIRRPPLATLACTPLPKTGTPATVWMKLRWCVPEMST